MNTVTDVVPSAHPRNRVRRVVGWLAAALVLLLVVGYLGISAYAANVLTTPRRVFDPQLTPASYNLAYQDVTFPTQGEALDIAAWYLPNEASTQAVILTHGKDGSRTGEFQGRFPEFAAALHAQGFAVLMVDLRGHGRSADAHLTFGIAERRDLQGAVDWLEQQGFAPGRIGVLGVSMGAASAIGATADDPRIGALVADCSFAEVYSLIAREWQGASGLPQVFLPSTLMMARVMFDADLAAARPIDEIDNIAPRPVLIIHGIDDAFTPVAHSDQLHAAAPTTELWQVPGAGHGRAYAVDPEAYVERVAGFFAEHLR